MEVFEAEDVDAILGEIYSYLLALIDEFQERGSGWVLNQLLRLDLHTYQYAPLRGSTFILLPPEVQAKKAVVNIQNQVSLFIFKSPAELFILFKCLGECLSVYSSTTMRSQHAYSLYIKFPG